MTSTTRWSGPLVLIPCSAPKRASASAASELYDGSTFRSALATARSIVAPYGAGDEAIRIVSAKHGLLRLDAIVAPYDVGIDDADAITPTAIAAQARAEGMDRMAGTPVMLLPRAYRDLIVASGAFRDPIDGFTGAGGIGDQRGVLNRARINEPSRRRALARMMKEAA